MVTQKRSDWTYFEQYFTQSGQIRYERNRKNSRKPSKFNAAKDFIRYVENALLKDKHSPDAVCTKTVYNYIAMGLCSRSKTLTCDRRYAVVSAKRKSTMTTAGCSTRVLTTAPHLLMNALPLEIGNLTPSSEKRGRTLCCLLPMNVKRGRRTACGGPDQYTATQDPRLRNSARAF